MLLMLAAGTANGQPDDYEIRMSGNYFWGEGVSLDRAEAVSLAQGDLIGRIVTLVIAEQDHGITEDDDGFSTFYASATRTISRMELRGLDHRVRERPDGSFSVLAWLHRDDYARSIETERERQIGLAEHAAQIEREDGLNRAIPFIYRAFLNTYYFPEPLYLPDEAGRNIEAREYYRRKLDRWASQIEITPGRPEGGNLEGDVVEIGIPLRFAVGRQAASELDVGLDIPGYGTRATIGGQTRLYLERLPSRPSETFTLRYRPALEDTRANRDWMLLAESIGPFYRSNITLDFTPVITIGFTSTRVADKAYRFHSRIENLSISHVEWDFGDGTVSHEWHPAHQFSTLDPPPEITLRLNRNPDLEIRQKLTADGLRPVDRQPVAASGRDTRARTGVDTGREMAPDFTRRAAFSWQHPGLTPDKRRFLRDLALQDDSGEILRSLQTHARHLGIRYGNRSAVEIINDSFVVIVDPQTYHVEAFLSSVQDGARFDLKGGGRVLNFEEAYRGFGTIWIQP